jgi:hypothetical protein
VLRAWLGGGCCSVDWAHNCSTRAGWAARCCDPWLGWAAAYSVHKCWAGQARQGKTGKDTG